MNAQMQMKKEIPLDAALDSFLESRWLPAAWQRVHRARDLPWRFQQLARRLPSHAWRAYSDGARLRFAVGKFVRGSSRQTDGGNLVVSFYDPSGCRCATGVWKSDGAGRWIMHAAMD